ncbi:MAG TPA: RNase adapter RapZ [Croceibacterium sp.]
MASESSDTRQRILLVTGMLGAGKSTAIRALEDLGWEAIDNFPIRLLRPLVGEDGANQPLAIGFDCRTRHFVPSDVIDRVARLEGNDSVVVTSLFLDCAGHELERRFNETRRRHFLAQDRPLSVGIAAERELMGPLRQWADVLIDTTSYSTNDLQQRIREEFAGVSPGEMAITVASFAFSRGMPPVADLVFDMRYLDNPHWVPELRELTGLDEPVGAHVARDPAFASSVARIGDLLLELLPRYAAQGRSYVNIAFGCTGGRHRSVFVAERIAGALREAGFSPTVLHRNLGSRAAEMIEGPHQP